MDAERPEKRTIRKLWVDKVIAHHDRLTATGSSDRLYLTLSGAGGRDIAMLIAEGVLVKTESGSLTIESSRRVAAIESNGQAVTRLLMNFPGLKVHANSFENLLHGTNPTRFPMGNSEELCRSAVVNLDLNSSLGEQIEGELVSFPLVEYIAKFCTIHEAHDRREWTLLLTLHGQINWSASGWQYVINFLFENLTGVPAFFESARALCGDEIVGRLTARDVNTIVDAVDSHRKILLCLLPKLVAEKVRDQRWSIHVDWCLVYGGTGAAAPMVAWAIDFRNSDPASTPGTLYSENVGRILENPGYIDEAGQIHSL